MNLLVLRPHKGNASVQILLLIPSETVFTLPLRHYYPISLLHFGITCKLLKKEKQFSLISELKWNKKF